MRKFGKVTEFESCEELVNLLSLSLPIYFQWIRDRGHSAKSTVGIVLLHDSPAYEAGVLPSQRRAISTRCHDYGSMRFYALAGYIRNPRMVAMFEELEG